LFCSPSIFRMIKLRRVRFAGHAAWMRPRRNTYTLLVGKPEGKRPLGWPYISGCIILSWIWERLVRGSLLIRLV
jgi:hypothetical protein